MADDKIKFWPIRGTFDQVMAQPYYDGKIYFTTDTNQIILDVNNSKHIMGGGANGSGITYARGTEDQIIKVSENVDDFNYKMSYSALENPEIEPQKDDLILNADGRFFRVLATDSINKIIDVLLLAVSGSGGGGVITEPDIKISVDDNTIKTNDVLIYGKSHKINVIATADTSRYVSLTFNFVGSGGYSAEYVETAISGEIFEFDLDILPINANVSMTVTARADNSNMPNGVKWTVSGIKVVEMGIKKVSATDYVSVIRPEDLTDLSLDFIPIGDSSITETLHVYIDDEELPELRKTINASSYNSKAQVSIPRQSHGSHNVSLAVSTILNRQELYSDRIDFEIAWAEADNDTPIIWIGDYPELVINYESASIPFMVYNPEDVRNQRPSVVRLFKNGLQISEIEVSYSTTGWEYWDISAIYELGSNLFAIQQGISSKEFSVEITDVGSRDLGLVDQPLIINMSSAGRSNNELISNRSKWENTGLRNTIQPVLNGFNWANNGWVSPAPGSTDYDNGSYLSIANGASIRIGPMGVFSLNNTFDYSFEIRFRVRNIQKYSTLVTNIPTYFYEELVDGEWILHNGKEDGLTIDVINGNENYRVAYDEYGSPWANEDKILQTVNTSNGVICSWLNSYDQGFVIGTQEAFFQSPKKLVSVRYKENEVINLAFVVSRNEHLVYIYLNGIPAGATELPVDTGNNPVPFTIENDIEFNSEYCDVDLYRFRLYQYGLSTPDVIHNYLSDIHSIKLYDQNQLTVPGKDNLLSYELLCQYNEQHPDEPTMPYAVWKIKTMDAEGRETLPYYKGDKRKADVSLVNPIGDMKLDKGLISPWFYYTHVPSTHAEDVEINVQGTSSQGYPRRNYKIKHKNATSWIFTHGPLEGESVLVDHYFDTNGNWIGAELEAQGENEDESTYKNRLKTYRKLGKNWHIDTESISTDQFTWKIDYMESSGSYNTGLANLMGNLEHPLYNKHPLSDLGVTATDMRTTVYGFPVLTFHEYANPSQNISDATATYEYVGRYNLNLDKSSNEYYGFKVKDAHPYVPGKTIAEVSECWEMKDNQGSWCSLRFPSQAAREVGFDTRRGESDIESAKLEMTRHYEVRYNPDADPIEAILGEQLNYNDTIAEKWRETVGNNRTAHNHYLRTKFYNLERLIYWLDSTDTTAADNGSIIWYEPVMDPETKNVTIQQTPKEYVEYRTARNYNGINGAVSVADGTSFLTKFYQNSVEYRKEKFRNEFEQHLDMHYCLVYFIMTELLLCFDSRGKNMMLASYGPHTSNGEYIWYPIFYDIDTQLGLNNSGAYLWDYDEDVTLNGTFSTSTSVLWNNLYDVFYGDIVNMYIDLRGSNNSGINVGNLTYTNIVGAYECTSEVFNSPAMAGVRPIIAMGLDEYYKYFATTESSGIGYYDTEGTLKKEATASYAYCCQGDKKLTTELLLRNRLNYMDSWWLAGSYSDASIVSSGIEARSAANNRTGTSDKYLDLTQEEINNNPAYEGFEHGDYPVPYFDSRAGFQIRPFLKQYVTYYVDGTASEPKKFNDAIGEENGVWTNVLSSLEPLYKTAPNAAKDQIFKIPGADYISSLGDLSIAYLTRFQLNGGQRLLDLHIGSDVPGYKNNVLDPQQFNLHTEINDSMKKPLLRSVNLTNIMSLATGINLSGSAKLEEFRGLDTPLTEVVFAAGAPLHTIHLPNTINSFAITEASNLTDLITSRPVVGDWDGTTFTYRDPATYRGLYIQDVTDVDPSTMIIKPGHSIARLEIHGGHLGYNSYKILDTLIQLKNEASTKNTLAINMTDVEWTPFEVVPYGEIQSSSKTYYQLTEHSTFEVYNGTNFEDWKNLTLNEKIYTKNDWDTSTITSFSLLDTFRADYEYATSLNRFTNTRGDVVKTYPALSGNMYIDNPASNPIDEFLLTDTYGAIWPDLTIRVANVQEAYIVKYIQVLDSGKEEEIDVIRYSKSSGENIQPELTAKIPSKQYHDFKGWSLTKGSTVADFATYDEETRTCTIINPQTFSSEKTVILLYAVFENHPYTVTFYNVDGTSVIATTYSTYGEKAKDPKILPITDESGLELTRTYKFKGYSRTRITPAQATDYVIQQNVVNVENINVTKDLEFYAVYKEQSVYDEVTNLDYFTFTGNQHYSEDESIIPEGYRDSSYNISNGYKIDIKEGYQLAGKITLPSYYNGLPIITLGRTFNKSNTFGGSNNITHIFWKSGDSEPCTLRTVESASSVASTPMKLKYIELPEGLRILGGRAFMGCQSIETITPIVSAPAEHSIILPSTLAVIGNRAFTNAFATGVILNLIRIPGSVVKIESLAIANLYCSVDQFEIGSVDNGSNLYLLSTNRNILDNTGSIDGQLYSHNSGQTSNMTFYYKTEAQYNGFLLVESYFSNIETKTYRSVN